MCVEREKEENCALYSLSKIGLDALRTSPVQLGVICLEREGGGGGALCSLSLDCLVLHWLLFQSKVVIFDQVSLVLKDLIQI